MVWPASLLSLPFFLQLLGFGNTPLGQGLCGAMAQYKDLPLGLMPGAFWYALLFMFLLALLLGYGLSLLLLPLLEVRVGEAWIRVGRGLLALVLLLFLLTRTTGLPTPGPSGWVLEAAPLDPLSLLTLAPLLLAWPLLRAK